MPNDITTRTDVELMVNEFYQKVQQDQMLDHVFNNVAKLDWDAHLPRMYDFWESVIFGNALYKGNPLKHHQQLHDKYNLTKEMFDTWVAFFTESVDAHFEGPNATKAKQSAMSIAVVLQTKTVYGG